MDNNNNNNYHSSGDYGFSCNQNTDCNGNNNLVCANSYCNCSMSLYKI